MYKFKELYTLDFSKINHIEIEIVIGDARHEIY